MLLLSLLPTLEDNAKKGSENGSCCMLELHDGILFQIVHVSLYPSVLQAYSE